MVILNNVNVTTYSGNLFDFYQLYQLTISSSTFTNLNPWSSVPPVRLYPGVSSGQSHTIKDVTFQNISVKYSVMLIDPGTSFLKLTLQNVNMDSIKKVAMTAAEKTLDDLQTENDFLGGGVCMMARKAVALALVGGTYTNIESNCIVLNDATLAINYTVFDNSGLTNVPKPIADDTITEADGVSFVTFIGGTTDIAPTNIVKILGAKFIENKVKSMYGGVIYSIINVVG